MADHRGGRHFAARRVSGLAAWLGAVPLVLAACAGPGALSLPDDHPASPRAAAGPLVASAALASYRSPADFAARSPSAPGPTAGAPSPGGHAAGVGPVARADLATPSGTGTINAVDAARRTVNLSHEPIPGVGWPAMTMDVPVGPSVDLGAVRPGTRVTFTLRRGPDGLYRIDSVMPAGPAGAGESAPSGGMPGMGHDSGGQGGMGQGGMGQGSTGQGGMGQGSMGPGGMGHGSGQGGMGHGSMGPGGMGHGGMEHGGTPAPGGPARPPRRSQ
jgi:Cu/Ag efflux protein CusF